MKTELIILGILAAFVLFLIMIYNKMVTFRNRYKNAFSQIDVQLKRRYDLIPNLVETAKGYMQHEKETLESVIQARNSALNVSNKVAGDPSDGQSMQQLIGAEQALGGALGKLFALSESYPDLKSNQNMMQLSEELSSTENKVAFARQAYNDAVMTYNTAREVFPNSIIANTFNFQPATFFEMTNSAERKAVKVSF